MHAITDILKKDMGKRKKNKDKASAFKEYNPTAPGALNADHFRAWTNFINKKDSKTLNKVEIKKLFEEFKKELVIVPNNGDAFLKRLQERKVPAELCFTAPKNQPALENRSRFYDFKILTEAAEKGNVKYLKEACTDYLPLYSNKDVNKLIAVCRSHIESDAISKSKKKEFEEFLEFLRPKLLKRGVNSLEKIGHNDWFKWPKTDVLSSYLKIKGKDIDWEEIGILKILGYKVGNSSSLKRTEREEILDLAFEINLNICPTAINEEWGTPASAKRLRKMANSIASFTRNAKRRSNNDLQQAIADWEQDLNYLYYKFYCKFFNFAWPKTK